MIELTKKAVVLTQLAYLMADVANTLIMDASTEVGKCGGGLRHEEKHRWNMMRADMNRLRRSLKGCTTEWYLMKDVDEGCEVSDRYTDIIKVLADRCGDDNTKLAQVRAMIFNNFKSDNLEIL